MKNLRSLIFTTVLFAGALCSAKSIYIVNNSKDPYVDNRAIMAHLSWKNNLTGLIDMHSDPIITAGKEYKMIVPAGHSLLSIDITPAINLAAGVIGMTVLHSKNHRTIRAHGDRYFVIETGHQKSQMKTQRQVEIKRYKSEQHYKEEIAKNRAAMQAESKSADAEMNEAADDQEVAAAV